MLDDSRGVVHDVQRLGEVVDDLLLAADPRGDDRSRASRSRWLVEAVVDSARAHAADAQDDLTCTADDPAGSWVLGSAPALRRAVLALVENADRPHARRRARCRSARAASEATSSCR